MPAPTQLAFSHKEVVTALLKAQGIHDGIWALYVKFGMRGMNVGASDDDLQPTALVPILALGLQKFDKITNISVNAAEVNPAPSPLKRVGSGKTPKAKTGKG
jgi:hypothetical protein